MPRNEVRLDRCTLYEMVWAKPMKRIAEELGVTAIDIANACDDLDVPRPGPGYWSKLVHGKAPERPELPALAEGRAREIVVEKAPDPAAKPAVPEVPVRETLRSLHPADEALRKVLAPQKPDYRDGTLWLRGEGHGAVIRVGPETLSRAFRILDALARALASRGHSLEFNASESHQGNRLQATVAGEAVDILLVERLKQVPPQSPVRQLLARKYDLAPSGRLTLQLHATHRTGRQTFWEERANHTLEGMLGHVVLAIEGLAASQPEGRREAEARERDREEERARRARDQERERHDKALGDDLIAMASSWSKAQTVRAFLCAVEEAAPEAGREEGFTAWLAWAKGYAARLDPLTDVRNVPKVLQPQAAARG